MKYNEVEFDFETWDWYGIDDDIYDAWQRRFPELEINLVLVNLREWLKRKPKFQEVIDKGYGSNWVFWVYDCLERAEEWRITDERLSNESKSGF